MSSSPARNLDQFGLRAIREHAPADDAERNSRDQMLQFLMEEVDPISRHNPAGHFTASAFISGPNASVMLVKHVKLDRWLQPGGHIENRDRTLPEAAIREAREETGLTDLHLMAATPLDLDVHLFPKRDGFPAHNHHDVRYWLTSFEQPSHGRARWFLPSELESLDLDHGTLRAIRKISRYGAA